MPSGLPSFWHERRSWPEQAASEADQALADSDQTASDSDQDGSDGDQVASHSDQILADCDQEAADLEFHAVSPFDGARLRAYEEAQAKRGEGTLTRAATTTARARISAEREAHAVRREENARQRDKAAAARDADADLADRKAATLAGSLVDLDERTEAALVAATAAREKAAMARARAATDRRQAARDREAAALDRQHLQAEIRRGQVDDLTGALRRGVGEVLIGHEIDRARRTGDTLHLAFADIDDLKGTNDNRGHGAGDDALRCLEAAFRVRLRPYDPIIRWGGDEFVCVMPGSAIEDAHDRIEAARADLGRLDPPVSVSFGLSSLNDDDTVKSLVGRADIALIEARRRDRDCSRS